jgi:Zn-dependent protease
MEKFDFYPKKPELVEPKQKTGLSVTIFSMVLFVLVFLLFLGNEFKFVLYLLIVLIIHELGHFLTMKFFKYKNVRMLFVPLMGAFVQGSKATYSQKESLIVTGAGPFPGMVIGSFLVWYASELQSSWLMTLALLFLLLNIINLLPLDPLDGGQLFKLFLKKKYELFLMVFAFLSSLFMIAFGWIISSYIIMLFGFFMGFRVRALQKRFQVHKELLEEAVNYSTTYKLLSNKDFVIIKNIVLNHTPALRKYVDQAASEESDSVIASQVNNVLVAPLIRDASLLFRCGILFLWVLSFITPVLLFYLVDLNWFLANYVL